MNDDSKWFVVQTRAKAENKAAAHLERQGYRVYLPRYLKRRRHARKVDVVAAPFFPRYLFVAIDTLTQRWRSVQSTIGVSHLVCSGDDPAVLPSKVIEELWAREDERGYIQLDAGPRFAPGDKIRVVEGVFTECFGVFEAATDAERVAILLDLLGRKVKVVLDGEAIAAA